VLTGLDRLEVTPALLSRLRGARVGLLAHPASVDRGLVHVSQVLRDRDVRPRILFGPEHGYGGEAQDMIGVADARDPNGAPIRSLYGARFEDLIPKKEDLAGIDILVVDMQDVGSRYYTFVWTAVLALRACAEAGVTMMILDRPNPIGGDLRAVEGRPQKPRFRSFVGLEPVPIRHSLTLGELTAWCADLQSLPREALQIVPTTELDRSAHAPAWDRPFVMPSPNMPTYETALVYPGGCLLEGTNLSDGRGTTRPFEITGAPWVDGVRLARGLSALGLPGMRARPLTFRPTFHKHAGKVCGGVQIHVTDPHAFRPVATYLSLITLAHHLSPGDFRFRTEPYEFVEDIPAFDLLTGDDEAREMIAAGEFPRDVSRAVAPVSPRDLELVEQAIEAGRRRRV
jgi:uncharacterized protein YbbC (DUF1343 family)